MGDVAGVEKGGVVLIPLIVSLSLGGVLGSPKNSPILLETLENMPLPFAGIDGCTVNVGELHLEAGRDIL